MHIFIYIYMLITTPKPIIVIIYTHIHPIAINGGGTILITRWPMSTAGHGQSIATR